MNSKKIGLWSATFLGISAIIGSGWLFAPYKTAIAAGPASILSWLIAVFIVGLLALCFTEIAVLYPQRGLSAIIPTLSHNKYFGFPFAIANWLGVVAIIALEADAVIQYLISLVPHLSGIFFRSGMFGEDSLNVIGRLFKGIFSFREGKLMYRHEELLGYIFIGMILNYLEYYNVIRINQNRIKEIFLPIYAFLLMILLGIFGDGGGDFIYFQF